MLGDDTLNDSALHHQHRMVLLQDIDDRLDIHIGRNGRENPASMKSLTKKRWVLCRRCCSIALTITDSEMQPTGTPRSITGNWEILFFSKISTARLIASWGWTERTGRVHDLGGPDLPWFGTVEHDDDLVEGADPGIHVACFDPRNHGLADPGALGKFRLLQPERFAARAEFFRCRYVHD